MIDLCSELKGYGLVLVHGMSNRIRRSLFRKIRHIILRDVFDPVGYPRMLQRIDIVLRAIETKAFVERERSLDLPRGSR